MKIFNTPTVSFCPRLLTALLVPLVALAPCATNAAVGPTRLQILAGDHVTSSPDAATGLVLRVQAVAADGSPVPGAIVRFNNVGPQSVEFAGGDGATADFTTDRQGIAETTIQRFLSGEGAYSIEAMMVSGAAAPVTLAVQAATPAHIAQQSGANQQGLYTHTPACNGGDGFTATSLPVAIRVTDASGNPVQGVRINWSSSLANPVTMQNCTPFSGGGCSTDANGVNSGFPFINYNIGNTCTTTFPSTYNLIATVNGTGISVSIPEKLKANTP